MRLAALIPTDRISEIPVAHTTHDPRREDVEILDARGGRKAWPSDTRGRTLIVFDSKEARRAGFRIEQIDGVAAACDALTRTYA